MKPSQLNRELLTTITHNKTNPPTNHTTNPNQPQHNHNHNAIQARTWYQELTTDPTLTPEQKRTALSKWAIYATHLIDHPQRKVKIPATCPTCHTETTYHPTTQTITCEKNHTTPPHNLTELIARTPNKNLPPSTLATATNHTPGHLRRLVRDGKLTNHGTPETGILISTHELHTYTTKQRKTQQNIAQN